VRAAKVDANHNEIVSALRDVGALVFSMAAVGCGFPDLCVGFRRRNYLLEVKGPNGKLNELQQVFHQRWQGQVAVVRTPEEALRAIGVTA
jgi:hypothetical protein